MKCSKIIWFVFVFLFLIHTSCKESINNEIDDIQVNSTVSIFEEHGFNDTIFEASLEQIHDGLFGNINGMVIMHDNELITEKYYNGWSKNDLHPFHSCTKSITSLLIGQAIDNQSLSLNDKMISFFSNHNISNNDSLKSSITIENMLTMSVGFDWDEWTIPYGETGNSLSDMYNTSNNYISYVLNLPVVRTPGEEFAYNSGITFLFGSILQSATGKRVENYAAENLFTPLGITQFRWNKTQGIAHCGGGLSLRPVDVAKIGNLVLNNGSLDGVQLISQEWITESMKIRHNISAFQGYGYHWFTYKPPLNGEIFYWTRGYGGQLLYIIPEYDMVIVITSSNISNITALSEIRLILDLISCSPDYYRMIMNTYDYKINASDHSEETYSDLFFLVRMLNRYGKYQEAIDYLLLFEDDLTIINYSFHFTFYLGYSYYHLQNYEQAKIYLNKHLAVNNNNNIHYQYYYNQAKYILNSMN